LYLISRNELQYKWFVNSFLEERKKEKVEGNCFVNSFFKERKKERKGRRKLFCK
jgi:hypothetical protein